MKDLHVFLARKKENSPLKKKMKKRLGVSFFVW